MDKNIAFFGAGSAAEAILSGVINAGIVKKDQIKVANKSNINRLEYIKERYQVFCTQEKERIIQDADILILAMKPYDLHDFMHEIKGHMNKRQLIISILAGVSTDTIIKELEMDLPVIRAMPNTSAMIGYSATAISKGKYASNEHVNQAEKLFNTIGTTTIVAEADMHIVTAISGSGPAYLYYMVEAMENAAIEAGLDQQTAKELITQTVVGAGAMLQQSEDSPNVLRQKITSPKGTTEAGIKVLEENHFQKILMECVKSAKARSEELGKDQ
ncbi:pyrroline-5-carboxylate reductase [Oceanobacillus salinisoli]|uniref:pyrroline-5-carboxylate reductase n=1 Tax=Oceanobacillus salinisoli TaxID=2678611 RepID=UPI0012E0DBE1|nr:pyrroline-5-carboxylate reductase [Oceanobacillus salinisoli]